MTLTDHISDEILSRHSRRESDSAEFLRAQPHLAGCEICRAKLARMMNAAQAFAAVRQNFALDDSTNEPEHLTYEQLEFFADNKLDEVDREIAESHFAFCDDCERDLQDLLSYRKIAQPALAVKSETIAETPKASFWHRLFAFDSIATLAPVAAVLLVAVLIGAWFFLRGNRTEEVVKIDKNQNAAITNFNAVSDNPANNALPENLPSPQVSPSEILPEQETLFTLNDGKLKIDERGNLQGAENLSPATRDLLKQSLQSGKVVVTANNSLNGAGGVLMSENNAENGVPFALRTPIGKVIRDAQPVLSWKPLKDARNYSVAIVDEKFRVVAESGKINSTNWKPSKPLPRGTNYSWQVTAILPDGTEKVSPSSPAPQARFRVIEGNLNDEISRLEKSNSRSHLALGVLYAKAGLKTEARAEFEKLLKENPHSPVARKLLQSVR